MSSALVHSRSPLGAMMTVARQKKARHPTLTLRPTRLPIAVHLEDGDCVTFSTSDKILAVVLMSPMTVEAAMSMLALMGMTRRAA